jgi:hypothetical protein
MSRPVAILLAIALALGATEAMAWWWMHPAPAGLGQPVLCYRPSRSAGVPPASHSSNSANRQPPTDNSSPASDLRPPASDSSSSIQHSKSKIKNPAAANDRRYTPLPEIYAKSAPMLRCSSGQVFRVQLDDGIGLHLAFFEWDGTDTGSVLEAYRHMPEACLGSLGMSLVSTEPSILYQVGPETLSFDHTVFRDPGQGGGALTPDSQVHAFRAVWVAGVASANARAGLGGDSFRNLRTIRLKSAMTRFRPAHACVIQAAVRGAVSPESAWHAFESAMLVDLAFEGG